MRHEQLDKHPKSSWRRLPVWVRGYGDECLRHCSEVDGLVCDSADPADVALVVSAHADEGEQLAKAIDLLVAQGFLCVIDGALFVTNYKTIRQRRLQTERQTRKRHGGHATPESAAPSLTVTPVTPVTIAPKRHALSRPSRKHDRGEERREEEKRSESVAAAEPDLVAPAREEPPAAAAAPDPVIEPRSKPKPEASAASATDRADGTCPGDLDLTAAQWGALTQSALIPEPAARSMLLRFVAASAERVDLRPRTLGAWRASAVRAIMADWQDPAKRPPSGAPLRAKGAPPQLDCGLTGLENAIFQEAK